MVTFALSLSDQLTLIEKLQLFKIQGRDKLGRKILRIVGKFFPDQFVSRDALKKYFVDRISPKLGEKPFSVVYFHTDVHSISAFGSVFDLIPNNIKDYNLEAVYFVHAGLKARIILATFGRFFFSGGLQKKINHVNRVDFLWDYVRRTEMEIPEFVQEHDRELDYVPAIDYGLECDHSRSFSATDASFHLYSMRRVA